MPMLTTDPPDLRHGRAGLHVSGRRHSFACVVFLVACGRSGAQHGTDILPWHVTSTPLSSTVQSVGSLAICGLLVYYFVASERGAVDVPFIADQMQRAGKA